MSGLLSKLAAGVVALLAVGGVLVAATGANEPYTVSAVLPAGNPNLIPDAPIYVDGFEAGTIESIRPEQGHAVVEISIDDDLAPLHAGAFLHVQWKAVVGERLLFVEDGPKDYAEIPSGGMVQGDFPKPTEVADVLAALDQPTRERLSSLVGTLQNTVTGHEQDLNATVQTAGPALAAVGSVLRGIGTDGPAIKNLVTDLNGTVDTLAKRQQDVGAVIDELSTSARATAGQREQLRAALAKLPPTLKTAQGTLGKVPGVTDEALPLLEDLRPATEKLPGVSEQLAPLLQDLRPLVADLKPTLEAASTLLDRTPGLLDSSNRSLPGLAELAGGYAPVLETLRPYTPEVTGFLTTWGSAGQNYDANGRYMRIFAQAGTTTPTVYPPGLTPPGIVRETAPAPGQAADTSGNGGSAETPLLPQLGDASGEGPR
ncbi:MlaD family protein [Pseudonocardia sp. KRD291]|uniref:MlaD family protein n=1 Tax=Pseudonocardia sp. KRD291 TaxID=2792007 RepID=UPI001C4A1192|nr:MCE family protein [Pseudonocardia sp. KRD291]MBW0101164.1 MCE family protein [Pseudonocardia sp. KRD291]